MNTERARRKAVEAIMREGDVPSAIMSLLTRIEVLERKVGVTPADPTLALQDIKDRLDAVREEPVEDRPPPEIADLVRENEPYGEAKFRLWRQYSDIMSKIADGGRALPAVTSEEMALHERLHRALYWLNPNAVEVV